MWRTMTPSILLPVLTTRSRSMVSLPSFTRKTRVCAFSPIGDTSAMTAQARTKGFRMVTPEMVYATTESCRGSSGRTPTASDLECRVMGRERALGIADGQLSDQSSESPATGGSLRDYRDGRWGCLRLVTTVVSNRTEKTPYLVTVPQPDTNTDGVNRAERLSRPSRRRARPEAL